MVNRILHIGLIAVLGLLTASCTEDIVMELPEGKKIPVVEGSITDECKRHEVILSYSSELYSTDSREMISGAEVYVTGNNDTIWYYEQENRPGHYLSDSVAGVKNRRYHFEVRVEENTLYSTPLIIYADTKMSNNPSSGIDSVGLLPLRNQEGIPFVDENAAVCVCPYFQTLSNPNIVYLVELYLNGRLFKNRPSKLFNLYPMQGYAGYYFNGPEMLKNNTEIPVGVMNKSYLHEGDVIGVKLYSISEDYEYFLIGQKLAIGVNPVMGAFPAMFSNLFSNCNAIGWFNATSVLVGEGVYHEDMFQQ
ncbi:MAG: DUF4249 family protein [Bacteroidales bacterium]|nr:DUF4249 family protein [Bacteroidales bacterium]